MNASLLTYVGGGRKNRKKKELGGIMPSADLGTKRVCPKCGAKFYDFGATDPIQCPKCSHKWRENAKKATAKPKKEPKALPPKAVRKPKPEDGELGEDVDLPEIEDDGTEALEPMEDDGVELTSLEEVEEHEEEEESDPNSDDADDDMFTEIAGEDKLVDDLEDHLEDEDEEDEDEDEDESDEDEDDDDEEDDDEDDTPKKRRR